MSTTKKTCEYRGLVPTLPAAGRHDLGDGEWRVLEPLRPEEKKPGRPPKWSRRQLVNGICWGTRTGSPGQKPLAIIVTAGQGGDSPQFTTVPDAIRVPRPGCGRPRTRPDRVLADKPRPADLARSGEFQNYLI